MVYTCELGQCELVSQHWVSDQVNTSWKTGFNLGNGSNIELNSGAESKSALLNYQRLT